ncbi:MAG: FKBP-type peptidyl-prolyl cis-trans isomerase N-terminal domain-containing protein, partial [Bdellovibrionales bacterium]|nr:FKBP-type peptidyl-prolyl cis-trans isomerase N-terminal domain-containing protein [Bdellovibrionales bacterium]
MMKKNILWLVPLSFLALSACTDKIAGSKAKDVKLENDVDRFSYALGQQYGRNLKSMELDYNKDIVVASMLSSAAGEESKLSDQEINEAFSKARKTVMEKQEKEAEKNLETGKIFLEKNKSAEGVKVTE